MQTLRPHQALVAPNVVLDGRLALFHEQEKWLAVADLHFGYEISQRAAGHLVPMWGMRTTRERLLTLLNDYEPRQLLIVGDLVHDRAAWAETADFLKILNAICNTIVIAGNHDRHIAAEMPMVSSWATDEFQFHHGHCDSAGGDRILIIGHHHPAGVLRDGAGLRLKCPAFVQQERCWILPAFSPWAAGANWPQDAQCRIWLCTPQRILRLRNLEAAAS